MQNQISNTNKTGDYTSYQSRFRLERNVKYLRKLNLINNKVLGVGDWNYGDSFICNKLNLNYYSTEGDLNYEFKAPIENFGLILCIHVIEHIQNPLFVFTSIKHRCNKDTFVYVETPLRPSFLHAKNSSHFVEFTKSQMNNLFELSGLKIIEYSKHRFRKSFHEYLYGIRPLLRIFYDNVQCYLLKPKYEGY